MSAKGTWKFVNNDKKLNIFIEVEANDFDINTLTDTSSDYSITVLATDAANNNGQKAYLSLPHLQD